MEHLISDSQAKARLVEAEERLTESRRGFFKTLSVGAAAAARVGGRGLSEPPIA